MQNYYINHINAINLTIYLYTIIKYNIMSSKYWILPTRDYAMQESVIQSALDAAESKFKERVGNTPRVREGYWYDLQKAGASAYDHSDEITFSSLADSSYGFPYGAILQMNVPNSKVFSFYGIADYSANPGLAAFQLSQKDVNFPIVYLVPHLYTAKDHTVYLNGAFPAIQQNDAVTITLYSNKAVTDHVNMKFALAESGASTE